MATDPIVDAMTDEQKTAVYIVWAVIIVTVLNFLGSDTWTNFLKGEAGMVFIGYAIYGVIWVSKRV